MTFGVLGPLEVRRSGAPARPLPPQQRLVLCLLLLRANTPVVDDLLSELLWDAPAHGPRRQRLFELVSRLRDALGERGGTSPIARSAAGYRLDVGPDDLDASRFERLRARGAACIRSRPLQALRDLEAAERLWRGHAYGEVDDRPEFEAEVRRLGELRASGRELRVEALLALGRHRDALDLVGPVAATEVLRDRTQYLYLLALTRAGRTVEARRHYESLWELLRAERLEPGPELKDLYERIITDDVGSLAPDPVPDGPPPLPAGAVVALEGPGFVGGDGRAAALARIGSERRPVVVVRGEAGSGKSRLVAEQARQVHEQGSAVLWGAAASAPGAPFRAFLSALRPLVGAAAGDDPRVVLERLAGGAGIPSSRQELFDAVAERLREAASDHDVLVVVDDLQWVGDDGMAMWHRLLRARLPGVTLAATLRAGPSEAEPDWLSGLRAQDRVTVVDLAGFGPAAAGELARHLGRRLAPSGAEAVVARTGGNAVFLLAVLDDETMAGGVGPVSGGVSATVLVAFHRLPPPARRLLEAVSLVDGPDGVDVVADAVGIDDAATALVPALEAGIVRRAGASAVAFRHDIVREAVREQLDPVRRRELHRQLGAAGETAPGDRPMGGAAGLARHFLAGGDLDRVVRYSVLAGHEAAAAFAHSEAAAHHRQALDAAALAAPHDRRRRCRLLVLVGEAEYAAYRLTHARLALVEALTLAVQLEAVEEFDRAVTGLVWLHEFGDAQSDAYTVVARAAHLAGDDPARRALHAVARARLGGVPPSEADRLLGEAEELARQTPDEARLGLVLATACLMRWRPDTLGWRLRTAEELRSIGERTGSTEVVLQALRLHAAASMSAGDAAGAREDFRRFVERGAGTGRPAFDAGVAQIENGFDLLHGRFAAVEPRLGRVLDGVAESVNFAGAYALQLHHLRREQGRDGETRPLLRALLAEVRFPAVRVAVALSELEAGDPDEGRAELARAVAGGLDAYRPDWLWLGSMALLADAAAAAGDAALARGVHERLAPFGDQLVVVAYGVLCLGSAHRFAGVAALAAGDHDEGVRRLRAAVAVDGGLGAEPALARDHLALGRALCPWTPGPDDVAGARRSLGEAADRAVALGMARVHVAATRALRRL